MDKFNYLKEQLTAALATWQQTNGGKTTVGWMHAANPEVIEALLAELEAKDKRIAELEGQLQSGFTPEALAQEERAENAEQRVAELEAETKVWESAATKHLARAEEAEKRLATPVRLPDTRQSVSGDRYQWSDGVFNYKQDAIAMLRAAGFTVSEE